MTGPRLVLDTNGISSVTTHTTYGILYIFSCILSVTV